MEPDFDKKLRIVQLKMRIDARTIELKETFAETQKLTEKSIELLAKKVIEMEAGIISNDTVIAYRTVRDEIKKLGIRIVKHEKESKAIIDELYSLMVEE